MPADEVKAVSSLGGTLNGFGVATWIWVVGLSLAGGASSFFRKVKAGIVRPFNVSEFIGECVISLFVGVMTFLLCSAAGFDPLLSAGLTGVGSHMGTRAIMRLEAIFNNKVTGQ